MSDVQFPIIIEKDEFGFFAYCPKLQGCYTQGDSYEEALKNIKEAIELHIEDREFEKEEILKTSFVSFSTFSLPV